MSRENIDNSIQECLIIFENDGMLQSKAEAVIKLKNLVSSVEKAELENKLFHLIMPKVPGVFEGILNLTKNDSFPDSAGIITTNIQVACTILEALTSCIKVIGPVVTLESIYSFPVNVLRVLARAYQHCEDSSEIYGSQLDQLSVPLGLFFRTTVMLQKDILSLIEQMNVSHETEKNTLVLCCICYEIQNLCELVSNNDVKLAYSLWKTYIGLLCRFTSCLSDELSGPLFLHLSNFITHCMSNVKECFSNGQQQKDLELAVKLVAFCLKSLMTICETFGSDLCLDVAVKLILQLYDLSVSSCSYSMLSPHNQEKNDFVQKNLITGIQPLIQQLLVNRQFLLLVEESSLDDYPDLKVPLCLLKTQVLVQLQEATDVFEHNECMTYRLNTFSSLLTVLVSCQTELVFSVRLAGVMCAGKAKRIVTFYEYMVTRLGAYISKFCACHFSCIETLMLKSLFCKNGVVVLLICDIWCFLARYGPASLCYSHCCVFARLLTHLNNSYHEMWIFFLLQRLVNLLTADQKAQFRAAYPSLRPELFIERKNIIIKHPLNRFSLLEEENDIGNSEELHRKYKQFNAVNLLKNKCSTNAESVEKSEALIHLLNVKSALCAAKISILLLPESEKNQLLSIILLAYSLWKSGCSAVQLFLISFLKPFAMRYTELFTGREVAYELFALLLDEVLSKENAVFRYETLCVFSEFAYSAKHRDLVKDCIKKWNLKVIVNNFFKKIPSSGVKMSEWQDIIRMLDDSEKWLTCAPTSYDFLTEAPVRKVMMMIDDNSVPPAIKEDISEVENCLNALAINAEKLRNYQNLPPWAVQKLQDVIQTLSIFNSSPAHCV